LFPRARKSSSHGFMPTSQDCLALMERTCNETAYDDWECPKLVPTAHKLPLRTIRFNCLT